MAEKVQTREALLRSALDLFSRRWYETVSVAEICRESGLSNGIFYHYFRSKESIFRELLDDFILSLEGTLQGVPGIGPSGALAGFLAAVAEAGKTNGPMLAVFREGQYRFPEYEARLREMYIRTLRHMYGRDIGPAEYLYITSGVRFLTNRTVQTGVPVRLDQVRHFVEQGVFRESIRREDIIFLPPVHQVPEQGREEDGTRFKLLNAGIALFGEKGFHNVNVFEIAKKAGFSVGTFYIHFTGKESFLSEIVDLIGRYTRHYITLNLDPRLNRLETELRGMFLFLHYFSSRRHYYEIVREAEFVVKDTVRAYYDRFAGGYKKNLPEIPGYDFYTLSNALIGLSHYLGIECLYSRPGLDSRRIILDLGEYLQHGLEGYICPR